MIKYLLLASSLLISTMSSAQLGDLLKQSSHDVYGEVCGIAGTPPEARILLEGWIKEEKVEKVRSWLTSPSTALQAYGAEGLIRLADSGSVTLSDEDIDRISEIKSSNSSVPTCRGCMHRELTLREALRDWELPKAE